MQVSLPYTIGVMVPNYNQMLNYGIRYTDDMVKLLPKCKSRYSFSCGKGKEYQDRPKNKSVGGLLICWGFIDANRGYMVVVILQRLS